MITKIRVLLADDHPALRMGLRVLLDRASDIEVVGEADDGNAALALIETLHPDVAVLDCQLPGIDGMAVAVVVEQRAPSARVVALSAYDDDRYLSGMMAAGAVGYLLKNEAPSQIVAAVQAAMCGETLWTPEQTARVERWRAEVAHVRDSLTDREREVLQLVADGLSNKEIAQALTITVRTADFHVSNILRKLGVISRVEATAMLLKHPYLVETPSVPRRP
jgi:NarL family two-component system response regulator LiaR